MKEVEFSYLYKDIKPIEDLYENPIQIIIRDQYLDTDDRALEKNGLVFRIRSNSYKPIKILYTLKGKTTINKHTRIPERLEEETTDVIQAAKILNKYAGISFKEKLKSVVQLRQTKRTMYTQYGFEMCLDETKFLDSDVVYNSIELESTKNGDIAPFLELHNRLVNEFGCILWEHSKFAVGKAIQALGFKNMILGDKEMNQIDQYYKQLRRIMNNI